MAIINPILITSLFFTSLLLTISTANLVDPEVGNETLFSYMDGIGNGPRSWGSLNPQWQVCDNGEMQSPIDLLDQRVRYLPDLGILRRNYRPAPATVKNRGHDITVAWRGNAGRININGTNYNLVQCHWHSPSEHSFNGTRYQMELHAVHTNPRGEIAVVGIVYIYGRPDPFLAKLLQRTRSIGVQAQDLGMFDARDIRFGSRKYFRYIGSLTVPPCTEGVIWTIIKKVRTVSREQVRALRQAVQDGFESNARPIQRKDGRIVKVFSPNEVEGGSNRIVLT